MPSEGGDEATYGSTLMLVVLDAVTCVSCVGLWMSMWSCLDRLKTPQIGTGAVALLLVGVSVALNLHRFLEARSKEWPAACINTCVWLWTFVLAVLSISIWRCGFKIVHHAVLPEDHDFLACVVVAIGAVLLLLAGRFRTACDATPVGFAVDGSYHGERFTAPSYDAGVVDQDSQTTLSRLMGYFVGVLLTWPVVMVWAGVWMRLDNHDVPSVTSFIICFLTVSILKCGQVEKNIAELLGDYDGLKSYLHEANLVGFVRVLAEGMWTAFLTVLVITTWRGVWDGLTPWLSLAAHPLHDAVADGDAFLALCLAIVASLVMAGIGRQRSSLFPPMDFTQDGALLNSDVATEERELTQAATYGTA